MAVREPLRGILTRRRAWAGVLAGVAVTGVGVAALLPVISRTAPVGARRAAFSARPAQPPDRLPTPSAAPPALAPAPARAGVCPGPSGSCYLLGAGAVGSSSSLAFASLGLDAVLSSSTRVLVPAGAKNPDVNRQGTLIVFERSPGYVWVMASDGTGLRPLSPTSGGGWMEPKFLPDGRNVVAAHDMGGGHNEIFEINVSTGVRTQLTDAPAFPWKWRPFVDATGTRLVLGYGTDRNSTTGPSSHIGIAPLPPPGQMISSLTPLTPVDARRPSYDPELSADGRHLLFDAGSRIWVANADGSGAHVLAHGKIARFDPVNPARVLYIDDVSGNGTRTPLFAVNVDGSGQALLADGNYAESFSALGGL